MSVRTRTFTFIAAIVFAIGMLAPVSADQKSIDREIELGKEAVAQAEKELKLLKDDNLQKRVDKIGLELAEVAKTTKVKALYGSDELANFNYVFKLVDDKDINAFSLPGGFIYVNKGLLDRVESDDELAGVIAHEIAHAAHHHMATLLKKQAKLNTDMMIVAAVAILSGSKGADTSNLLLGAQLLSVAKLNTYGREAEKDSDIAAVAYMLKTKYNPVGMLTFMEKLARDHTYRQGNLGIFATHPPSGERAEVIIAELKQRGVDVNRRAVSKTLEVSTKETDMNGQKVHQVLIADKPVFTPAPAGGQSSKDRADAIVMKLDAALDKNPNSRDIKIVDNPEQLMLKDTVVIEFLPEDAKLAGSTLSELVTKTKQTVDRILYDAWLKQAHW